ncbi:hypothetical protein [Glutamicibacter sp. M10]|uniref:hypothetical protein n=1 Tax=Glutamicibacter sp. M10 TaxID=3023076 RepID=UPI0021C85071|nr:hypothetical protein [Glutamicibacter sp. M10]UXN32745.1 hypothetical protein N6V40_04640 [Glutamicibacter sp. M10]
MGFLDKVKDLFGSAKETLKDPDKNLVENTWPAGEPDDEHVPEDGVDLTEYSETDAEPVTPDHAEPITGVDPELDAPDEAQYRQDER